MLLLGIVEGEAVLVAHIKMSVGFSAMDSWEGGCGLDVFESECAFGGRSNERGCFHFGCGVVLRV